MKRKYIIVLIMLCFIFNTNIIKANNIYTGYINSDINVKIKPNGIKIGTIHFNKKVKYCYYNKKWAKIDYKGGEGYVLKKYIVEKKYRYKKYKAPKNSFKSWMDYRCISDKSSKSYKLQQKAITNKYGIRTINNRYCIAMGTGFDVKEGDYVDLVLDNGKIIYCIIGDIKDNSDTDSTNKITKYNGCICEFIVDSKNLHKKAKYHGDMSKIKKMRKEIKEIKVYKNVTKGLLKRK